jgi:hypothetical protein
MRTYVDLTFSADGPSPVELAEEFKRVMGLSFIVGEHDLVFEWETPEEFRERLEQIHQILRPTGAYYRVATAEEEVGISPAVAWPPALNAEPRPHPAYSEPNGESSRTPRSSRAAGSTSRAH